MPIFKNENNTLVDYSSPTQIMGTDRLGVGKVDGETITVDADGTLHSKVTVDSELSKESENPVQNKVIAEEIDNCVSKAEEQLRADVDYIAAMTGVEL